MTADDWRTEAIAAITWANALAAAAENEPRTWTKAELAALEVDGDNDLWMDASEIQTAENRYENWLDRAGIA